MANPTAVVVGTGFIGPIHVEALRRIGVRVKGVLGSTVEKSRAAAARLGVERGYESYEAVMGDAEVTAVHLASPNRYHHAQVLAALAAGKHVICEKPLALNAVETESMSAAEARHPHLVCAICYNVRFYPLALHARALVQRGELGDVFHLHGSYAQDWLFYPTDFNWRVLAEEGGGLRTIGDIGTHLLDLVTFVSGLEVDAVMADLRTVHPVRLRPMSGSVETFGDARGQERASVEPVNVATEDCGAMMLRFRGGARGVLSVSQVTAGRKNCIRFEIAGSKCALAWNSESPNELWIGERSEPSRLLVRDPALLDESARPFASYPGGHNEGYPDSFKQLFRAIYDDIAGGRRSMLPLYATFADGHREALVREAIVESVRNGRWATVRKRETPGPAIRSSR